MAVNIAVPVQEFGAFVTVMLLGQVTVGAMLSKTVMLKEQVAVMPSSLVAI